MKYIYTTLLLLTVLVCKAQESPYQYFKVEGDKVYYERVFDAKEGYRSLLESHLKGIQDSRDYSSMDSSITFFVVRLVPQEPEIMKIKARGEKGFQKLRVNGLSFNAEVSLKDNRYKVLLTNIQNTSGANPEFDQLSDISFALYSSKNKKFRSWSEMTGKAIESYLSLIFELPKGQETKSDW